MARIGIIMHAPRSTHTVYQFILRLYQFNTNGNIDAHTAIHDPCVGSPDEVVRINNTIYQHTHRQWFDCLPVQDTSFAHLAEELQRDMHGIVNKISSDVVLIDPRFCYTWPAWKPLFDTTNDDVFFVVPYHSPHENAATLYHDDGIPLHIGYMLWSAYMLAAERHSRNVPRFMINHENLIREWATACGPLIAHINQSARLDAHVVIQEFMDTYKQIGHPQTTELLDTSSPAATFAGKVYDAYIHQADAAIFDQLDAEFVTSIIPGIDLIQYRQFVTATTTRMRAAEAYIQLLQTRHLDDIHALHQDYTSQLEELYTNLNQNAAAIDQKLTSRIHELHDFYEQKIQEPVSPEQHRLQELTTKIQKMTTMIQQRTQHVQDLKYAVDKQKSTYDQHMTNISHDIAMEREYYQQTIANLTKQVAWQQQILDDQGNQLNMIRGIMPVILLVRRILKSFKIR